MKQVKLDEFIRTGKIGSISLGASKAECVEVLGEPEAHGKLSRKGKASLYKYGILQIVLELGLLRAIYIYLYCEPDQAEEWKNFVDFSDVPLSRTPLLAYLREHDIACEVVPRATFDDAESFRTSTGVWMLFERPSGQLEKVGVSW